MIILTIIMALHVCAAVDDVLFRAGIQFAPVRKVRKLWAIQDVVNTAVLLVTAIIIFKDEERLRYALYKIANVEPGENQKLDDNFESLVIYRKAVGDSEPGEPVWVTKICVSGMFATLAIWLLELIH